VTTAVQPVTSTVSGIASGTAGAVTTAVQPVTSTVSGLASGAVGAATGAVTSATQPLTGIVSGVAPSVVGAVTQPVASLGTGGAILSSLGTGPAGIGTAGLLGAGSPAAGAITMANEDDDPTVNLGSIVMLDSALVVPDDSAARDAFVDSPFMTRTEDGNGDIHLQEKFTDESGRMCRKYVQTVLIGGGPVHASAIVCKDTGSVWRVVTPVLPGRVSLRQ
jgi:hypothetical protein